ncbi:MAG TPA: hypothetical protein VD860_14575 [Azospirillum sp.]|nr:hypothetical protein [Azospirillum sp.]
MPGYDPVEKFRDQPPPPRTRKPGHGDYARKEKDYEPQTVPLAKDGIQMGFLDEPPRVSDQLVPGSRFSNEDWERAAYMIASGCAMIQVAKAMGASRATIWRAYTTSKDFRVRIWWERQHLIREAKARIRSLRNMVATQLEHAVLSGDMTTVRWLADRLGMMGLDAAEPPDDDPGAFRGEFCPPPEVVQREADSMEAGMEGYRGLTADEVMTPPLTVDNLP